MLTSKLIHPEIMSALAYCGHGSKVLIADGNYPLAEKTGNAKKVYLGLVPGMPTVTEVLKAIHSAVEIEKAEVMGTGGRLYSEILRNLRKSWGWSFPVWEDLNSMIWQANRMWFWQFLQARRESFPISF